MKKNDVAYFPTQNETKASVSERVIKTIKSKFSRYLTFEDEYTYLPILQDIVQSYNKTFHRTIGTAPINVNANNEEEIRISTYFSQKKSRVKSETDKLKRFKYKIVDYVLKECIFSCL